MVGGLRAMLAAFGLILVWNHPLDPGMSRDLARTALIVYAAYVLGVFVA